jgi:hypothetical protein
MKTRRDRNQRRKSARRFSKLFPNDCTPRYAADLLAQHETLWQNLQAMPVWTEPHQRLVLRAAMTYDFVRRKWCIRLDRLRMATRDPRLSGECRRVAAELVSRAEAGEMPVRLLLGQGSVN